MKNKDFRNIDFPNIKNFQTVGGRYKRVQGQALEFLKATLTMSPRERITADEGLMHPWFEDLRAKDPELQELSEIGMMPYHERIENLRKEQAENRNNFIGDGLNSNRGVTTIKNFQNPSNKIRIKTISENSMIDANKKRGPNDSYNEMQMQSKMRSTNNTFVDDPNVNIKKNQGGKTLYNIYENGANQTVNESNSNLYKGSFIGKKNHPVYTQMQFHSNKGDPSEIAGDKPMRNDIRSKIDEARRSQNLHQNQNIAGASQTKFRFMNGKMVGDQFNNATSHSLSHIDKKYNFSTTTGKFQSRDRKFNGPGVNYGSFNSGMTQNFLKTENYGFSFGANGLVRQLPALSRNNTNF